MAVWGGETVSVRIDAVDEGGAAVVEMVMILPVLALLVCGILDMGAYLKAGVTVDTAATTAVRYLMDDPTRSADELQTYLGRVDPAFGGSCTEVAVAWGDAECTTYTHRFYNDLKNVAPRNGSTVTVRPVAVTVTYTGAFLTPLGRAVGLATGTDGSLVACSTQVGELDLTDGATW